jgi:tetratricopeptide (TPR) repeat protein
VWNNLANFYGEFSPVTNAFLYYGKAIELDSNEPVYYQNLATTVYLFRHDATNYYHLTVPQVFDKALALYRQAMQLDPGNLVLATDYAMTYYGIQPMRTNDALVAWTNALNIAHNETEREGVYIHLARIKLNAGRFDDARADLATITNASFADLRRRLERNLNQKEHPAPATNAPPAADVD